MKNGNRKNIQTTQTSYSNAEQAYSEVFKDIGCVVPMQGEDSEANAYWTEEYLPLWLHLQIL